MTKFPSDDPPHEGAVKRHELFPTRIWQVRLTAFGPRIESWTARILALRAASPAPAGRSMRLGWNSGDLALLKMPEFAELSEAIGGYCRLALMEMGLPDPAVALESWANVHDRGGFNFPHTHRGALLSGSFYLQAPAGSGGLRFRDPRPGVVNSFAHGSGANACADVEVAPEAGMLVLFPVWLEHYVEPHDGDAPRISIAFNAMLP